MGVSAVLNGVTILKCPIIQQCITPTTIQSFPNLLADVSSLNTTSSADSNLGDQKTELS